MTSSFNSFQTTFCCKRQHRKITRTFRFAQDWSPKHSKEKLQTLHTLFPCNERNHRPNIFIYHSWKLRTNLKQLKSLKRLNFDLEGLPETHKGIDCFVESLKHLKNLSILQLYFSNTLAWKPFALCQALRETFGLPRMQIRLFINIHNSQTPKDDFIRSLRGFGELGSVSLVNITTRFHNVERILEYMKILQRWRSLKQLFLTIDNCGINFLDDFERLVMSLKEIKSLRSSRVSLRISDVLFRNEIEQFKPKLQEISNNIDLVIVFKMKSLETTWSFLKSSQNKNHSNAISAKLKQKIEKAVFCLFVVLSFIFGMLVLHSFGHLKMIKMDG